ncbi:hypothetical protein [Rhizosphaericola mali]|uniref:Uncharacterized protein n=1 Tax=Rhizosphaericola mali TaxID=2545455 RepID=A0A5P2FW95_9BACT|nr:hypothetical protein [Rhizosphaericola mali]QES87796.1 hypothetical protein E0W69_003640 [Rhizosphaericola mali]
MEDKELTEIESFQLIQDMINKSRSSVMDKGTWPIYWGCTIAFCSFFLYFQLLFKWKMPFNIFYLTYIALAIMIFVIIKNSKHKNVSSHSQRPIAYTWIAYVIAINIMGFDPQTNYSGISFMVLYGIPTFITGGIMNYKPLILGGISCWILAIIGFFCNGLTQIMLEGFAAIAAWVIPGLMIRRRYLQVKKGVHV